MDNSNTGQRTPYFRRLRMSARALIWTAFPQKPAVYLQYELSLRGRSVSYRQTRRMAETGDIPQSLWGEFLDVMDHAMAKRAAQIAEADRQIKLARDSIRHVVAQARVVDDNRSIVQEIPLPLKE
jgi:hypothetical protein